MTKCNGLPNSQSRRDPIWPRQHPQAPWAAIRGALVLRREPTAHPPPPSDRGERARTAATASLGVQLVQLDFSPPLGAASEVADVAWLVIEGGSNSVELRAACRWPGCDRQRVEAGQPCVRGSVPSGGPRRPQAEAQPRAATAQEARGVARIPALEGWLPGLRRPLTRMGTPAHPRPADLLSPWA